MQGKIYDVSVLVQSGMPIYPGDPGLTIARREAISSGALANVSSVAMGAHTGTHVDAPRHVNDNWPALQELDLTVMVGPAAVYELNVAEMITANDLERLPWDDVERVLFKTRNSRLWNEPRFVEDFVYLADDGARFLAANTRVRLVGIDYLSVERFGAPRLSAHAELLGHGISIVEGLNLSDVSPGQYEFICLPLKLATQDGAPARAILIG